MTFATRGDVARYEGKRYKSPDQRFVHRREQLVVDELIRSLGLGTARVLDAPCGYGRFSTVFAHSGARVICADLSPAMIGRVRDRFRQQGRRASFVVMDIRHLPLRDGAVDATFTMRLFHHRFAREAMGSILKELARVSHRWVILSYYRVSLFHRLVRRLRKMPSQIQMMTDAQLAAELSQAPLTVLSSRRLIPLLHAQTILVLQKADPRVA